MGKRKLLEWKPKVLAEYIGGTGPCAEPLQVSRVRASQCSPGRETGWVATGGPMPEKAERTAIVAETRYRKQQQFGVNGIAQRLHISKVTLYKCLRHRGVVIHSHRIAASGKPTDCVLHLEREDNYLCQGIIKNQ